jgi:hypothetical protein
MGIISLVVILALIWIIIGGGLYIFPNIPDIGRRIMIAVGALLSILLVLSTFGLLPISEIRIR